MKRLFLFITAVFVLYIGGFIYDEVGPLLYAVVIALIASTPVLLKTTFWKKLILMFPLLVLRVVGKVIISVFGKNALSKLLAKYGLLERRFNQTVEAILKSKDQSIARWLRMRRSSQAYLLLIFFPVVVAVLLAMLIIEILRLRFFQFIIEKLMHSYLLKWTSAYHPNISKADPATSDPVSAKPTATELEQAEQVSTDMASTENHHDGEAQEQVHKQNNNQHSD